MKKTIFTLLGFIGIGMFSQQSFAQCYCQVGYLSGNICLVPQAQAYGGTAAINPICPAAAPAPAQKRKQITFNAAEMEYLERSRDIALAFSAKTGQYGVIAQSLSDSLTLDGLTVVDLQQRALLQCVAKSSNTTLEFLTQRRNKRQAKKLIKESGCQVENLQSYNSYYNTLWLMRGRMSNGSWKPYWLQYNVSHFDAAEQDKSTLRKHCKSESVACEEIGNFYDVGLY